MKDHIIVDLKGKKTEVLPFVTIYGANASGKTKLVNAIEFMQQFIIHGTRADEFIKVDPYRLDPSTKKSPGRFEIIFKHKNILYTYGFVVSETTVHEEWLFAYFTSKESKIFERITKNNKTEVDPGTRLLSEVKKPDFIQFIAQGTRPNKLFITEAFDKNVDIIKDVIHWFREHLQIIRSNSQYNLLTLRAYHENEFIKYLSEFLKIADTGINAIKCEKEEIDPDRHLTFFPDDVRDQILEDINQGKNILLRTPNSLLSIIKAENGEGKTASFIQLKTEHLRKDGEPILFKISDESDGTRRLLDLAPMLLDIWERDRVFVIDELDRSLHTHLSRLFIKMCIAGVKEKQARGQFIMTTHDTNLLDRSMLRRDEIVLMEKDQYGSSHITSLAEYKVTEGLNYENGYLNGRFGAIPFIGDIKSLLG